MPEAPEFSHCGKQVLRDGALFAEAATPDIAEALAHVLRGQVLLHPDLPAERQDWVAGVLWA